MLNYLWAGMMIIGILWGAFHGQLSAVTEGALQSSKEAVTLCITMLGVMSLWTGVLEIGHRSGLVDQLSRKMSPLLTFLFPRLSPDSQARKQIAVNMIANILGLGWAATPAGINAMEELKKVEEERREEETRSGEPGPLDSTSNSSRNVPSNGLSSPSEGRLRQNGTGGQTRPRRPGRNRGRAVPRGTASNEMCTFLIINISSLQLIPMNMIAYRSQYGSVNPTAIVGPALAATLVSTVAAVIFCKLMDR